MMAPKKFSASNVDYYKGPTRKAIGYGDPMQRVNYQISLYPPHENRKIEKRVRKRHQKIS